MKNLDRRKVNCNYFDTSNRSICLNLKCFNLAHPSEYKQYGKNVLTWTLCIIVNFELNEWEKSRQNLNELMSYLQAASAAAAATHPIKSDVEANSKDLISIHIFSLITINHFEMYVMITTHHIRNDELRLVTYVRCCWCLLNLVLKHGLATFMWMWVYRVKKIVLSAN